MTERQIQERGTGGAGLTEVGQAPAVRVAADGDGHLGGTAHRVPLHIDGEPVLGEVSVRGVGGWTLTTEEITAASRWARKLPVLTPREAERVADHWRAWRAHAAAHLWPGVTLLDGRPGQKGASESYPVTWNVSTLVRR
jgi:hypothetical protein